MSSRTTSGPGSNSAPGREPRRDAMSLGIAALNKLAGSTLIDRFGLRRPVERTVYEATRTGFRTIAAASRTFLAVARRSAPARLPASAGSNLFDLTPTDEQRMVQETVRDLAADQLRPVAAEADAACATPEDVLDKASELGLTLIGVPEELGGAGTERSAVTNVLVAEALAQGDMGQAVAILAPSAVSTALVLWGDGEQQARYLPAFVGDNAPAAALALAEPRPLFDALAPATVARRTAGGYVLDGVKSLVPRAAEAELFVVGAQLEDAGPVLFVIESSTAGLTIEADPSMGVRAAGIGRLVLERVTVPDTALLGSTDDYRDCVRLSRLAWCGLALGTAQAVLDYVIPYVNGRVAFGEPISHRQAVAFKVADIGIELDGMRLATYRAASLAEQGKPFDRQVALARILCADKGMRIGSDGVQLLGGHGYVKEHPVERWYRDMRAIGVAEGAVLV